MTDLEKPAAGSYGFVVGQKDGISISQLFCYVIWTSYFIWGNLSILICQIRILEESTL